MVQQEQSRAIAEVQSAIVLAKQFPRNQVQAMDRILNACTRPGLAEKSTYAYARGGTEITGPSIRLAEAMAQNWGNIQYGIRELDQRHGVSTVQAFCWDMETNVRQVKDFQVRHERFSKKYNKPLITKLEDPRDIYEVIANQGARRLRACILGIIPGDVVEAALEQCQKTLSTTADAGPEAQKKLLEKFAEFGVTKEQIEKRIQRRMDSILPAQIISLRNIYNSLKDNMSAPSDWFEAITVESLDESRTDSVKSKLAAGAKASAAPPAASPTPSQPVTVQQSAKPATTTSAAQQAPKPAAVSPKQPGPPMEDAPPM
jgi:hypothetical protein